MSVYQRPGSQNWYCKFQVNGKRYQLSTGETVKKRAEAFERRKRIEAEEGRGIARGDAEKTYGDALRRYNTPASMRSHARQTEYLSDTPLTKMVAAAHEMRDEMLEQGYNPLTINRRLAVIMRVLNLAYKEWEWLEQPLGTKIKKLSEKGSSREYFLTREEVNSIAEHMQSPFKEMLLLAVYTGLRRGNLLNVQPSWWKEPYITVPGVYTKSKKPITLLLPESMFEFMDSMPWNVTDQGLRGAWERARKEAGMSHIRWHDLRHTFASWMIQDGDMPIAVLREVMGHSSVTVTEKYAHLAPSYADAMGKAHRKLGI